MSGEPTETERLARLEEHVASLQNGQSRIEEALADLAHKFSQRERTNWPVLLTIVGLFLSLVTIFAGIAIPSIGAFLLFTDLRSTNLVAQLRFQEIAPLTAASELSKRDRHELRSSMEANADKIAAGAQMDARMSEMLREVETQIKSIHDAANLRDTHYMQLIALLYQKSYGDPLPLTPYYVQPKVMP